MGNPKNKLPKYRQLFEEIRDAIFSGKYRVGDRLPSETALVQRYNISRPTAARALRDLENAGLVQRRHGSGTLVLHSSHARGGSLGLLVPGLGQGEIFEPICNQIAKSVQAHNFTLFWGDSSAGKDESKTSLAKSLCQQYIDQRVAGVFFEPIELMPGMEKTNQYIVKAFQEAGIPVILIDCDVVKFPRRSQFDLVRIDNRRAGYLLTEHLLKLGCKRIDFVSKSSSAATIDARIAGYRDALLENEIIPQLDWMHRADSFDIDFARHLIKASEPEAIICGNDYTAALVMRDLTRLGVRIPQEIRIVGIDDLKYASALSVPLTTIHQPCRAMGRVWPAIQKLVQGL